MHERGLEWKDIALALAVVAALGALTAKTVENRKQFVIGAVVLGASYWFISGKLK